MKKLTIRQARRALGNFDRLLAVEGEMTITRRGTDIARVVPVGKQRPIPSHQALRQSMRRMPKSSERMIRKERDAR
jgi:antitoxin (DNA-binding transcriptional repressor) of toxin-antitoxin stability system